MKLTQLFEFDASKQSPLNMAVTPQILDAIERKLDALYKNINVDVDFSRHFAERLSDARNDKPITVGELVKIFTDAYKKYAHIIKKSPYEYQAVLTDLSSLLNVPFVLNWDSKHKEGELKAKTIMRKPDFQTSNPKLVVESQTDNYYMREGCGIYAVALSIVNPGGEIWIISNKDGEPWSRSIPFEVTHVVYRNAGKLFDVKGQRSLEAICADFDIDPNEYPSPITTKGPFTPEEFMKKFMGSSDTKPLYGSKKDVEELVKKLQNKKPEEVLDEQYIPITNNLRFERGGKLHDVNGEAGRGLYAYVAPNLAMKSYYTSKGEELYSITPHKNAHILDLTKPPLKNELLSFARDEINNLAKDIKGYVKPKLSSNNVQRFGRIIESFILQFYPDTDGYIVVHVGSGVPTGKQIIIKNWNAFDISSESKLDEAQQSAVYVKEIPDVYRKLPVLGKGLTSIVMDKGDGNVLMFTRDDIKKDWLTKDWGIKIGNEVAMLDGFAHKKMAIRNMPIYVIELPKLFKLDTNNKRILKTEMMKWDKCYAQARIKNHNYQSIMIDAVNDFIEQYPNSPLIPIMEFMQNYSGYVNMDLAPRNTLQDAHGNMIFVDPLVSKELLDVMYNRH